MDCKTASSIIAERANREHCDTEALAQHLASCRGCREQARDMQRLGDLLDMAITMEEPPEDFEGRVAARLGTRATDVPHTRGARRWGAFAAFAAGVTTGLILAGIGASLRRSPPGGKRAVTALGGEWVGTLIEGDGVVQVLPPGHAEPITADGPLGLVADSLVWARGNRGGRVAPRQGGLIRLSPDAVARFTEGGVTIYRGTAHLDVCRADHPFVVELPAGQVLLDQAELSVSVDGRTEDARLQIHRGWAWVGNRLGSVDLGDGQQAVAAQGAPPIRTTFAPIGLTRS